MNYRDDREWAGKYDSEVMAILIDCFADYEIIGVRPATDEEDTKKATDMVVEIRRRGATVSEDVAVRVRDWARDFRDLTIRVRRQSGAKTEMAKLKEGFSRWYLYCWCNQNGYIADYIIADMDLARSSWILDLKRREFSADHGETCFVGIPVSELRQLGCLFVDNVLSPCPEPQTGFRARVSVKEVIMARKREELVGTFNYLKNRFPSGCVIATLDGGITIKGDVPDDDELCRGITYRFFGRWDEHPKWGKQFIFSNYVVDSPNSKEGVVRYLIEFAAGVGHVKAARLFDTFGPDAIDILADNPDRVVAAKILTADDAAEASKTLRGKSATRKVTIDLMGLFDRRGFPRSLVQECIKLWGTAAADKVREDPFCLLDAGLRGAGFLRCDQLYLDTRHDPAALRRQMFCIWHAIKSDRTGSTWLPIDEAAKALRRSVAEAQIKPKDAINLAIQEERLAAWQGQVSKGGYLALHGAAANEQVVAEEVKRLRAPATLLWPDPSSLAVSSHQAATLAEAFQAAVCILTGTPGTGKTFCAAAVARALCSTLGTGYVGACAPTGKAAVRLTQKFLQHGVLLQARTIHSTLGVMQGSSPGSWTFAYGKLKKLPFRVLIVDEFSMTDTDLFAHLLIALPAGCHLLLVGDQYQLMPVGHGAPLRDLLAAGIPHGELTEIRRNSGLIVHACRDIKDGKPYKVAKTYNAPKKHNFLHFQATTPEATVAKLRQVIDDLFARRIERATGVDHATTLPPWDIFNDVQIIVARNKGGPVTRREVNNMLQQMLNPHGKAAGKNPFKVDDKIVCLRNGANIPLMCLGLDAAPVYSCTHDGEPADVFDAKVGRCWFTEDNGCRWHDFQGGGENKTTFVANGEIGRVMAVDERITIARFPLPDRVIKIPMGIYKPGADDDEDEGHSEEQGRGCSFDLGYAITTHKSQGSEFPVVIVLADKNGNYVCSRNWMYTAFSRASELLITIGPQASIDQQCRRIATNERKTFLKELLT